MQGYYPGLTVMPDHRNECQHKHDNIENLIHRTICTCRIHEGGDQIKYIAHTEKQLYNKQNLMIGHGETCFFSFLNSFTSRFLLIHLNTSNYTIYIPIISYSKFQFYSEASFIVK